MTFVNSKAAPSAHAGRGQPQAGVGKVCRGSPCRLQTARRGRQVDISWQQQQQQQQLTTCAAISEDAQGVSYDWSWNSTKSSLPEASSAFDAQYPTTGEMSPLEALNLVSIAAGSEQLPSQQWMQRLVISLQPHLQHIQTGDICQLLQHLAQLDYTPDAQCMAVMLQQIGAQRQQLSPQQLSLLLWSLSNLRHTLQQQFWEDMLRAAEAKLQDFYGPDLAQFLCAAGSIFSSSNSSYDPEVGLQASLAAADTQVQLTLPPGLAAAVAGEVEYQVCEFVGDLSAFDLARLASGLADLGIEPSAKLQDALLKAVYMRTRTIEEKGAVDFALAKLDAKGKKSMHYDPRWTHEELKWLPRRERDKRRIIKENWYRTQWGGFGSKDGR